MVLKRYVHWKAETGGASQAKSQHCWKGRQPEVSISNRRQFVLFEPVSDARGVQISSHVRGRESPELKIVL